MSKNFRIQGEKTFLQFRAETYNTWNHTQFNAVGQSFFTPAAFGKVTSAKPERSREPD